MRRLFVGSQPFDKQSVSHHAQKGFSLIEIMVVMVIVGIIISFVIMSFGDFGGARRAKMSSNHLASLIKLARINAIVGEETFGLDITSSGYRFYELTTTPNKTVGQWQSLNRSHIFRNAPFPPNTTVDINGLKSNGSPNIIITSTGRITPFSFTLSSGTDKYAIKSLGNGDIQSGDR